MMNIQVIDGAENCVYDIFAAADEDFRRLFPNGQDIAFIDEIRSRVDPEELDRIFTELWKRRLRKRDAMGVHGIIFYGLDHKAIYYPARQDEEGVNPNGEPLQ